MIKDAIRTGGLGSLWEAPSVKGINKEACGGGPERWSGNIVGLLPSDRNVAVTTDSVF
jgi:hypothetical protein